MSPSFCVQTQGEVTGCVGQRRSFSVKVVFSEYSDPLFIQVPFEKGLAKGRESFLLFFQLIWLVTVMCTPSPDVFHCQLVQSVCLSLCSQSWVKARLFNWNQ